MSAVALISQMLKVLIQARSWLICISITTQALVSTLEHNGKSLTLLWLLWMVDREMKFIWMLFVLDGVKWQWPCTVRLRKFALQHIFDRWVRPSFFHKRECAFSLPVQSMCSLDAHYQQLRIINDLVYSSSQSDCWSFCQCNIKKSVWILNEPQWAKT